MTLIELLLILLLIAICYVAYVMRQRISQMKEFREGITQFAQTTPIPQTSDDEEKLRIINLRAPTSIPDPHALKIESELDELYSEVGIKNQIQFDSIETKENILISKLVDHFIRETDRRLLYKTDSSGSK